SGGIVQTLLSSINSSLFGLNAQIAGSTVQLRLMSGPERCLVSAPRGGDCDCGEHDGFGNLRYVMKGPGRSLVFGEMMGQVDVGSPFFWHVETSSGGFSYSRPLHLRQAAPAACQRI